MPFSAINDVFMLKDKSELLQGVSRFLPKNRNLAFKVWKEMQQQISNYIHGKLLEILIVTLITYIIFLIFGLNYPLLLAFAVGLSVLVPILAQLLSRFLLHWLLYSSLESAQHFGTSLLLLL